MDPNTTNHSTPLPQNISNTQPAAPQTAPTPIATGAPPAATGVATSVNRSSLLVLIAVLIGLGAIGGGAFAILKYGPDILARRKTNPKAELQQMVQQKTQKPPEATGEAMKKDSLSPTPTISDDPNQEAKVLDDMVNSVKTDDFDTTQLDGVDK